MKTSGPHALDHSERVNLLCFLVMAQFIGHQRKFKPFPRPITDAAVIHVRIFERTKADADRANELRLDAFARRLEANVERMADVLAPIAMLAERDPRPGDPYRALTNIARAALVRATPPE